MHCEWACFYKGANRAENGLLPQIQIERAMHWHGAACVQMAGAAKVEKAPARSFKLFLPSFALSRHITLRRSGLKVYFVLVDSSILS